MRPVRKLSKLQNRQPISTQKKSKKRILQNLKAWFSTSEGEGSSEDREDEEEHEEEEIDYEHLDKSELLELITSLSKEDDPKHFDKHLKPIKARFDDLFESERKVALDKFLEEGNEEGDFEYKGDETSVKFQDYYNLLRSKRANYYSGAGKKKAG